MSQGRAEIQELPPPVIFTKRLGLDGQVGWTIVSREESEERRGDIPAPLRRKDGDRNAPSPLWFFFDDLLDAKVREFNRRCIEKGPCPAAAGFRHVQTDIYGSREFPVRRSLNRRKRKDVSDRSMWPHAAAKFPGWEFWSSSCQNRLLASGHFSNSLLRNSYIV